MGADAFVNIQALANAAQSQDYALSYTLPDIPLWVPEEARKMLDDLALAATRLALHDAAGYISDEAGKSTDSGALAQSFLASPPGQHGGQDVSGTASGGTLQGRVFSSLPYAVVIDQGRRPGSPISMAGIDAIGLWAQRKLGLTAADADRAKWAIAINIMRNGFPGTGFFETGVERARPRVDAIFGILATQIAVGLTSNQPRKDGA